MKRTLTLILLVMVITFTGCNLSGPKIWGVKFNYNGQSVLITYSVGDEYKLYNSSLDLRHQELVYSGIYCPKIISNPVKNIILYWYENKEDDDVVSIYDLDRKKLLMKVITDLSPNDNLDRCWHPDGERFFYESYKGLQMIDLKKRSVVNLSKGGYPLGKNHEGFDAINWSAEGDVLFFNKGEQVFSYQPVNGRKMFLFSNKGFFQKIFPSQDQRYIIFVYDLLMYEGYIGVYDQKFKTKTLLYRMKGDGLGDPHRHYGLSLDYAFLTKDDRLVFSVCEFDDTNAWGAYNETAIYVLNPFTKKLKRLAWFRGDGWDWDYNKEINKIVVKKNDKKLELIDVTE